MARNITRTDQSRRQLVYWMLEDMGIEDERLRLEWISASEGAKVKAVINDMTERIRKLGPLDLSGRHDKWDTEMLEVLSDETEADAEPEEAAHV